MKKIIRRVCCGVLGFGVLLALGISGVQFYLSTSYARQFASKQIAAQFGLNVLITHLNSGLGWTTTSVILPTTIPDAPLLFGSIRLDTSVYGLALGQSPRTIRIENAVLNLHLDQNGDLITKFPDIKSSGSGEAIPQIVIVDASVHIKQDGKPDFHASGVSVTVTDAGTQLKLNGSIDDPSYGTWTLTGEWGVDGKVGSVQVNTDQPLHMTPLKLKAIPFVPNEAWANLQCEGDATAQVHIGQGADAKWFWHVVLNPVNSNVKIIPIDLILNKLSGKVVIDGKKVTLEKIQGSTAGGTIDTEGTLDFGPTPSRMQFQFKASGLDVKKTPPNWGLSSRVDEGRLNGKGDITLLLQDGKIQPQGTGRAVIRGKLLGGEAEVEVMLQGDGKRLKFVDSPAHNPSTQNQGAQYIHPNLWLGVVTTVMLQAPPVAPAPQPPALQPPKDGKQEKKVEYVRANLKLTDVDLAELIKRANITTPVQLAGKISLQIAAEIPTSNPGTIKYYRATGKLSTPSLQIEGLNLSNVTANVELRDGVLQLTELSAKFPPDNGGKPGSIVGTARFGVDPRGELTANLKLDRVPLDHVVAAIPGYAGKAAGSLSGLFDLKIPGTALSSMKTYVANGELSSAGLTLFGQKLNRVSVHLALRDGVAKLTKTEIDVYGGTVTGDAELPLIGNSAGQFKIGFKDVDSAALTRAIPESPVKLDGKFGGTLTGTLPPLPNFDATKITGQLDLDAPRLIVQGFPTTKLTGKLGYLSGAITYALKGDVLGGAFDVDGTYPLTKKPDEKKPADSKPADPKPAAGNPQAVNAADGMNGTLRLQGIRLDQLARALRNDSLSQLSGIVNLSMRYRLDASGPVGSGRVVLRGLGWGDTDISTADLATDIRLTPQGIEAVSFSGEVAQGTVHGRAIYYFDQPQRSYLTLSINNADVAKVFEPLGIEAKTGRVSVAIRTTIGHELRGGGTITATRTNLQGIEVSELRIPLRWSYVIGRGLQLNMNDAMGTIASGRVTGRAEVHWHGSARVQGRMDFVDINVGSMVGVSGIGKATGQFDFSGGDVRSAKDLNGSLNARFGQTTIRELPILGTIAPFLSPVQALTRFESGQLVARLGGGMLRIESMTMISPAAKLFVDGTVSLLGQLDLAVVYNTSQIGPSAPLLKLVARNIPAIGPIPVGVIVRVTEALSNRVVRLRIYGSVNDPKVQVNAVGLLSENAVRFFLGQYVPLNTSKN